MERFDNIDIFFIAIIGAYFITLACLILTLIIIGIKKIIKNNKVKKEVKPVLPIIEDTIKIPVEKFKKVKKPKDKKIKSKEKTRKSKVKEIIPKLPYRKLSEIPIIQKLFMKEITPTNKKIEINNIQENLKPIETTKGKEPIKLPTTIIDDTIHVNTKKYDTEKVLEKQKSDLEQVIEQINKADALEKQLKETAIKEESKDKKEEVKVETSKEETTIENKTKKTTNKNTTNKKSNNQKSNNSKSSTNKNRNNNSKKRTNSNNKKKKNTNNKKKNTSSKGKKNNKKKTVKRKKS